MATKKKTTEENEVQTYESQLAAEQVAETAGVSEPTLDQEVKAAVAAQELNPKLESLAVLADRHRVVGWQQSALLRLMDWQDDKFVSDAEYRAALESLKNRRIGGGRR